MHTTNNCTIINIMIHDCYNSIIKFHYSAGMVAILKQQLIFLSVDQMDHPIVTSDLPVIKCCTDN